MELTRREREVAGLVAQGLTNRAIADRLFLSERTVEGHIEHALGKLNLERRTELAAWFLTVKPKPESDIQLPVQLTRFVGRQADQETVRGMLARHRLVTLLGPGGVGKSRLAQAVAETAGFNHVRLLELAPVATPERVRIELEATLAGRPLGLHSLLILDNCEHLVGEVAGLAESLLATSGVTLLATSREPLRTPSEATYTVGPMTPTDAVALFTERTSGDAASDVVQRICERLDFLPLAVELAAARTRVMTPAALLKALDDSLGILTSGSRTAPDRHHSLQQSLEWSYRLLNEEEQRSFRSLGVFAGPFELEHGVAVAVAPASLVLDLAERSLLSPQPDGRYRLLEPVRQFAASKLDQACERAAAEARLDRALVATLERDRDLLMRTQAARVWKLRADILPALDRLRTKDPVAYSYLAALYVMTCWQRVVDRQSIYELALAAREAAPPDHPQLPVILMAVAQAAVEAGDPEVGLALNAEARIAADESGDPLLIKLSRIGEAVCLANMVRPAESIRLVMPYSNDPDRQIASLVGNILAMNYWLLGDPERGEHFARRSLQLQEHDDQRTAVLDTLALCLCAQGRVNEAAAVMRDVAARVRAGDPGAHPGYCLLTFARIAQRASKPDLCATVLGSARAIAATFFNATFDRLWEQEPFATYVREYPQCVATGAAMEWRQALEFAAANVLPEN